MRIRAKQTQTAETEATLSAKYEYETRIADGSAPSGEGAVFCVCINMTVSFTFQAGCVIIKTRYSTSP